jgi:hypothetical protein
MAVIRDSSKRLMAIAQELAREAFQEFLEAKKVSDRGKGLKRLSSAVDIMIEATNLRTKAIELQLADIRSALRSFDEKPAPKPQKTGIVQTD